jgi:hypothetical protein
VAIANEMRGFRGAEEFKGAALLVVMLGRFGVGSLIRFGVFQFRFVHVGGGYFVFFGGPVAEIALAALSAAEGKFRRRFRIDRQFADGTFQFHFGEPQSGGAGFRARVNG